MGNAMFPQAREVDEVSGQGGAKLEHDQPHSPTIILDGLQKPAHQVLEQLYRVILRQAGAARRSTYDLGWTSQGTHLSVLSFTVKVRAPKNLRFSSVEDERLAAICHPSGDFWTFWRTSWISLILSGGPGA
jgi:hypothetical protein